ncbi:hypothetical protein Mal4_54630 [Maioricimonas rarisocia]|uniref:Carboxypeptidase regulatory-like domain-containing protein n=1 Tax=Maioricimonas rarisocia TaxID=2528026 RepID=A0A517ZF50_9PLAN|nr:hypothetical protein [Maioricimonas rarisocia]QDU41098.1 hypothetical protein Mal4_54630 [Maioricimonas rarisocia]
MNPLKLSLARLISTILLVAIAGILSGCGKEDWQAETVAVTGSVTINGEIPVGAMVKLHPTGEKVDQRATRPSGIVAEDGTFALTTYDYGDGAPSGEYIFTIIWPQDPRLGGLSPDRLNYVYGSPKTTQEFIVRIDEETTTLPPVEITGAEIVDEDAKSKKRPVARSPFPGGGTMPGAQAR